MNIISIIFSIKIIDQAATVEDEYYGGFFTGTTSPVPIPATAWLFGFGSIDLIVFARRKR